MKNETNGGMSAGQERRYAKKVAAAKVKASARNEKVIWTVSVIFIIALVVLAIWSAGRNKVYEYVDEAVKSNGLLKDFDSSKDIILPEVSDISVSKAEYEFSDGEVEAMIQDLLDEYKAELENESANAAEEIIENEDPADAADEVVFDDEFVRNYLKSDMTAEEYRAKLKADSEEELIGDYVIARYFDAAEVINMPKKLLRTMKSYYDTQYRNAYSNAAAYYGYTGTLYSYYGVSDEEEFLAAIDSNAYDYVLELMIYQCVYEKYNLQPTDAELSAFALKLGEENGYDPAQNDGKTYEEYAGKKFLYLSYISEEGRQYILDHANIER